MPRKIALLLLICAGLSGACKKDHEPPTQPEASEEILFFNYDLSSSPSVAIMNGDGSNQRTIAGGINIHYKPVVSHSGDSILFYKYEQMAYSLYVVGKSGGTPVLLARNAQQAAWSPDDSQIAFVRAAQQEAPFQVFLIGSDGSRERQLTQGNWAIKPSWFPDGNRLLFGGKDGFYTINADGSNQQKVGASYPANAAGPVLSPDGARIAFSSARETGLDLYVMKADGSELKQVASNTGKPPLNPLIDIVYFFDLAPVWSADGTRLSYNAWGSDEHVHIYAVNADGKQKQQLTASRTDAHSPAWSADGQRIYYTASSDKPGGSRIKVINATGGVPADLSGDHQYQRWPIVMP